MTQPLKVPSLGESVQQATVGAWLKQEGEVVLADEPLVEVESEKATVAVPSPVAGVLRRQVRKTGETVAVGDVIGEVEEGAEAAASTPAPPPGAALAAKAAPAPPPPAPAPPTMPAAAGPVRASPAARRLMAEHGIDPATVAASGGAIRKPDVLRASPGAPAVAPAAPPTAPARPAGERERLVPMSPLRRTVARRLVEAQQSAAILTTFNEVDMSRVLALRDRHGPAFLEKHGVKLGFMSLFVKAAIEGLRAFPSVNAEIRGDAVVFKDHYDIGVAVGGGKGLVVPVVRDADRLSFAQVEQAIGDLSRRARENRITMEDLAGGTFTISNGGIYGSLLSTPILNPPQSGILGLHKIQKRAVVLDGDVVAVRPMMYLALSYDHRLIDGREAVGFLVKVKESLEEPERMLLEL
ncbi:MAG: 2-oxoglutarate dehydrogenase complex dihydrolipoyllysine-residue succinyltransferase [Anaeromyxobacter sp.]|nr:2-oxoglutarate dehydrogenase complex dihydrolipoyllysine-residue succinyltransferase [Anaeromyxobacter sp.]MBL0277335.1 2-oxoglutarate dehydrogenase complex dihydrolipoyllysine-residue succinyltransferase [Anaeromyxobacter sp.]